MIKDFYLLKQGYTAYKFAKAFKNYKKSDSEAEKIKSAKLLTSFFEKEGGIFLKIAQYLGTKKDEAQEIQELSNRNEKVIEFDLFKELISTQLNQDIENIFQEVDKKSYSASIGQVQKGILLDGSQVAIKVQYPNIKEKIYDQLKLLKLIPTTLPEKKWGVNIDQYKKLINNLVENELDYNLEREKMIFALDRFKSYDFIKVPKVYTHLCTDKLLISEFIQGETCNDIINWSEFEKKGITKNLLKLMLVMIYQGHFQADANHGNFLFIKKTQRIALLDFGQFEKLPEEFSLALLSLIYHICCDKEIDYGAYFLALGFNESKLSHIEKSLEALAKIIFEPFTFKEDYSLNDWNYKAKIDACLGQDKWWFRSAGGDEFFLVMKAFMGIKNLIDKLEVSLSWQNEFLNFIKPFEHELLNFSPKSASH